MWVTLIVLTPLFPPSLLPPQSGGWYSWCLLLYMVLLTVLILMLCVFLAFMAYTTKIIADNCSSVESQLDGVKNGEWPCVCVCCVCVSVLVEWWVGG